MVNAMCPKPIVLLVVDDQPADRELLSRVFRKGGYEVLTAGSGLEALALLRERRDIALVVTDLLMPEGNGWVLTTEIRRLHRQLPVVLTSGATGVESPRAYLHADGCFLKSDPPGKMLEIVAECLPDRRP